MLSNSLLQMMMLMIKLLDPLADVRKIEWHRRFPVGFTRKYVGLVLSLRQNTPAREGTHPIAFSKISENNQRLLISKYWLER